MIFTASEVIHTLSDCLYIPKHDFLLFLFHLENMHLIVYDNCVY